MNLNSAFWFNEIVFLCYMIFILQFVCSNHFAIVLEYLLWPTALVECKQIDSAESFFFYRTRPNSSWLSWRLSTWAIYLPTTGRPTEQHQQIYEPKLNPAHRLNTLNANWIVMMVASILNIHARTHTQINNAVQPMHVWTHMSVYICEINE